MTMLHFFHERINKRKGSQNGLGEQIDQKDLKNIDQEFIPVNNLTALNAINTVNQLLSEVKDIEGERSGTIAYKKASVQNYLTKFLVSLFLAPPSSLSSTRAEIQRSIRSGFPDSLETKKWIDGATTEALVIENILKSNPEHIIGLNNLTDAMYAIDFFEEIPDQKILRLVQVKTESEYNKNYTLSSPDVQNVFKRQLSFLKKQSPLQEKFCKQNEIPIDEYLSTKINTTNYEFVEDNYKKDGNEYLEFLMQIEYDLSDYVNSKKIELNYNLEEVIIENIEYPEDVNNRLESFLFESSKKKQKDAIVFAQLLYHFYTHRLFEQELSDYAPRNNKTLDYFYIWLRSWIKNHSEDMEKVTNTIKNQYNEVHLVYHIQPAVGNPKILWEIANF